MKNLHEPIDPESETVRDAPRSGRSHPVTVPPLPHNARRLYRSRKGWVFGVCKGLADYAGLSVFWVRTLLVLCTLLSWVLPFVILYTVAAFFMKPEPQLNPEVAEDWKSYTTDACEQSMALARLKRELEEVEHETIRLERDANARQFDWEQRLKKK